MGAYLSQAKTDKESTNELNAYLEVGASSMQGWRNSQEDAHNCILEYGKCASFFGVYDGHGGAEVAIYCAEKFPAFLKDTEAYKKGKFEQALRDAFLSFDKMLLQPDVISQLKVIASEKNCTPNVESETEEEVDDEDLVELHEEMEMPLDILMEKYKGHPSVPVLKKLKEKSAVMKPQSPLLRPRRAAAIIADATNKAVLDADAKPIGSSTSKAALAAATAEPENYLAKITEISENAQREGKPEVKLNTSTYNAANGNIINIKNNSHVSSSSEKDEVSVYTGIVMKETKEDIIKGNDAIEISANATNLNETESEPKYNGSVKAEKKANITVDDKRKDDIQSIYSKDCIGVPNKINDRQTLDYSDDDNNDNDENDNDVDVDDDDDDNDDDDDDDDEDEDEDEDADIVDDDGADYSEIGGYLDEDSCEEEDEDEESLLANENFCVNMIEEPGKDSGCTAVVSLLIGRDLYVANAGDSRCVVCRGGKAIEMSLDHKPEDDKESARIIKAGGRVTLDGRVNGGLNLSRALGDHGYKMNAELSAEEQMISALPDIKKLIIMPEDEFMVLACDGIWNFMSSEEVVHFVRLRMEDSTKKISDICEELFDTCLAPNTMGDGTGCDNMTAVIVRFKPLLQELDTKLSHSETEDVVLAKYETGCEKYLLQSQKRANSPEVDDNSNEMENQTKRMKTDDIDNSCHEQIAGSQECGKVVNEAHVAPVHTLM